MHKKSMEAAHKLTEDDGEDDRSDVELENKTGEKQENAKQQQQQELQQQLPSLDKEELRSESIASLRAKAQSYTAKIREAIGDVTMPSSVPNGGTNNNNNINNNNNNSHHNHHHPHHNLHTPDTLGNHSSSFDTPNKHSDSCDSELLDPAN